MSVTVAGCADLSTVAGQYFARLTPRHQSDLFGHIAARADNRGDHCVGPEHALNAGKCTVDLLEVAARATRTARLGAPQ